MSPLSLIGCPSSCVVQRPKFTHATHDFATRRGTCVMPLSLMVPGRLLVRFKGLRFASKAVPFAASRNACRHSERSAM